MSSQLIDITNGTRRARVVASSLDFWAARGWRRLEAWPEPPSVETPAVDEVPDVADEQQDDPAARDDSAETLISSGDAAVDGSAS